MVAWLVSAALAAPVAFVGGTVYPVSGPPVRATLVIDEGTIVAVGQASADATVIDVTGGTDFALPAQEKRAARCVRPFRDAKFATATGWFPDKRSGWPDPLPS